MFKEMQYVYAIYQEKSFTKAARKLYISQPALSLMVKKAENKVGMPLFDRSTTPISLTSAGAYYIEQAEHIMQICNDSKLHFLSLKQAEERRLRLGGPGLYQAYVFPAIISEFQENHPDTIVSWVEARNQILINKLLNGDIDLFPEVDPIENEQLDSRIWKYEQLVLAVPIQYSINKKLEKYYLSSNDIFNGRHLDDEVPAINIKEFRDAPFILMSSSNDTFRRTHLICGNAGFRPNTISMFPTQMLTAYHLAENGQGVTLVCDTLVSKCSPSKMLCFYKLDDPAAIRPMYIYTRKNQPLPNVADEFLNFILKTKN